MPQKDHDCAYMFVTHDIEFNTEIGHEIPRTPISRACECSDMCSIG